MTPDEFSKLQAAALERLSYDPETGVFVRRIAAGRHGCWRQGRPVGSPHSAGYLTTMIDGKNYFLHRLAFVMMGIEPVGVVDHINGDPRDNRFANLRLTPQVTNTRNAKRPKSNTSGTVGVGWDPRRERWCAQIMVNRRRIHLGRYVNKEDALRARKAAELEYGFHPNHGR